ncbi:protein SIEVE ELEMENT OCCLUSION B-like isoform X1 [Amaranthus tricolor]|uniref:protein SIEVE ELEMENT OCCLUSION B-like isoform X1 n=2 Tax=Amaranthus tricolor TaxID=29722 RepID=UPI0025852D4F|nr:protein SIEVE ELEMENT OCCLUSION B-like isoform X1 [Amaranthus tricolor]
MAGATAPARRQRFKGDRHLFSSSDDAAMLTQLRAIHAPDGRDIDVRPLLHIIEDIFYRAAPSDSVQGAQAHLEALDDKAVQAGHGELMELLAITINKISCEITCKCSGRGDAHATSLSIFNMLSNYSWDAKVALALAAFAVYYGDFWLVSQLHTVNSLAKSVAILKQLPEIMEHSGSLKPKFEAISNLIRAMVNVTKCIVEFKELPSQYITEDTAEYESASALIPTAAYWIIRSIVACASQIAGLISMSFEYVLSTTEAWEISSLAHKVSNIYEHLRKQLDLCYQHIDEKKHIEAYQLLVRAFETPHLDNMKILRLLIYAKDDQPPLFDGSAKKGVNLYVLRRRNVLLLISDLELSNEELSILDQMYQESRQHPARMESQYEVVWLPIVDKSTPWTEQRQKQFESLQSTMPWYTVYHPSLVDPAVMRYAKEVWHFNKKCMLVVLDPQGRVTNPNALHMMWIWGSLAFPFTSSREEALWREETWRLDLLADAIEPMIFQWMQEAKYICLYGGEDMEWIQRFTTKLKATAQVAGIPLEMLYVGKSSLKEKIRTINEVIAAQTLSHVLPDITLIWYFWVRLESMWHSKMQHGKTVENDSIMQEIVTLMSFDASDEGWALISRGSTEMTKAKGETFLTCLNDFEEWKNDVPEKGFVQAIIDYLKKIQTPHHCNRLILPGTTGGIPEKVVCAECGRTMEKFIMYRCCSD